MQLPAFLQFNETVSNRTRAGLIAGWIIAFVAIWTFVPFDLVPTPQRVFTAFLVEWKAGAAVQMMTSLIVSIESILWASAIGLTLCYLSTIEFFKPVVQAVSKARFWSLIGLTLIFIMAAPDGHALKVMVLTFAMTVNIVNSMMQTIADIPKEKYDYARTLGLSKWEVTREVVIRGTLGDAFEAIRINAAIAWMMLTLVEGLSRSEGGIGVLLLSLNRGMNLDSIIGIQFMILFVGIGQDYLIKAIKVLVCPYTVDRK